MKIKLLFSFNVLKHEFSHNEKQAWVFLITGFFVLLFIQYFSIEIQLTHMSLAEPSGFIDEEFKEEFKDHDVVSQGIANQIFNANSNLNTSSRTVMEWSGTLAMFDPDLATHSIPYSQERITEHNQISAEIMTSLSPNNSPGSGMINVQQNYVQAASLDNQEALIEDKAQVVQFEKDVAITTVNEVIQQGTWMNREDSMNDLYN